MLAGYPERAYYVLTGTTLVSTGGQMPNSRITKRTVDAAAPGAREYVVWDPALKGFGLKVTPAGRKVYLVQYRIGGRSGRTRRYTIGPHGAPWTADKAREAAKRVLGDVSTGRDPMQERDKSRTALTVRKAMERFLSEHVAAKRKATTAREYERIAANHVLPAMASERVDTVPRARIAKLHRSMAETPYMANLTLAMLSKFFNWCELNDLRPDNTNPCRHVEKYREAKRERFLSERELALLGKALAAIEAERSASPWAIAAVRLLILTGARLNEILTLQWAHVDIPNAQLRLPDSKSGVKSIYLNAPALDILANLPRLEGNPYVCCGQVKEKPIVNLQKPWQRIRDRATVEAWTADGGPVSEMVADLRQRLQRIPKMDDCKAEAERLDIELPVSMSTLRLHDLRHSFASVGAAGGLSLPVIGALLGHTQAATTQRYSHLSADPVRAAAEQVGRRIAGAMRGALDQ